jgi:hypothetical protein
VISNQLDESAPTGSLCESCRSRRAAWVFGRPARQKFDHLSPVGWPSRSRLVPASGARRSPYGGGQRQVRRWLRGIVDGLHRHAGQGAASAVGGSILIDPNCGDTFSSVITVTRGSFMPGRVTIRIAALVCARRCGDEIVRVEAVLVPEPRARRESLDGERATHDVSPAYRLGTGATAIYNLWYRRSALPLRGRPASVAGNRHTAAPP